MFFSGLVKGMVSPDEIKIHLDENGCTSAYVAVTRIPYVRGESETHFEAWTGSEHDDTLEKAMHSWFQVPGEAPFPQGTLLHFSYRTR